MHIKNSKLCKRKTSFSGVFYENGNAWDNIFVKNSGAIGSHTSKLLLLGSRRVHVKVVSQADSKKLKKTTDYRIFVFRVG